MVVEVAAFAASTRILGRLMGAFGAVPPLFGVGRESGGSVHYRRRAFRNISEHFQHQPRSAKTPLFSRFSCIFRGLRERESLSFKTSAIGHSATPPAIRSNCIAAAGAGKEGKGNEAA